MTPEQTSLDIPQDTAQSISNGVILKDGKRTCNVEMDSDFIRKDETHSQHTMSDQ